MSLRAARALVVVAIAGVLVWRAPVAWACVYAHPSSGDVQFVGVAVDEYFLNGDSATVFVVEEVMEGEVGRTATVWNDLNSSCVAPAFGLGNKYRVGSYWIAERLYTDQTIETEGLGYVGLPPDSDMLWALGYGAVLVIALGLSFTLSRRASKGGRRHPRVAE